MIEFLWNKPISMPWLVCPKSWSIEIAEVAMLFIEAWRCRKMSSFLVFHNCHHITATFTKKFDGKIIFVNNQCNTHLSPRCCTLPDPSEIRIQSFPYLFAVSHWKSRWKFVFVVLWHVGHVISRWGVRICLQINSSLVGIALLHQCQTQFFTRGGTPRFHKTSH